jgi:hypothetical protein
MNDISGTNAADKDTLLAEYQERVRQARADRPYSFWEPSFGQLLSFVFKFAIACLIVSIAFALAGGIVMAVFTGAVLPQ